MTLTQKQIRLTETYLSSGYAVVLSPNTWPSMKDSLEMLGLARTVPLTPLTWYESLNKLLHLKNYKELYLALIKES